MWKDFFYFSRTERQGVIILAVLIIGLCITGWLISASGTDDCNSNPASNDPSLEAEYNSFIASLQERKKNPKRKYYPSFESTSQEIRLFPFNPNTVDSATLTQLGLPAWMARNILRYRRKGGTFHFPEDFKKVYGLTAQQYTTLFPYIQIPQTARSKDTVRLLAVQQEKKEIPYKYPTGTMINLNEADTTELKKIPGIGSHIAQMIVHYRKRLGGYYQIEQLEDIQLKVEKLRPWFTIINDNTARINLNRASIERLMKHPYINFYQAKAIIDFRKKNGTIKSLKQFALFEEFTPTDLDRISHYICYN